MQTGLGFLCDRKCSEMWEDHLHFLPKNWPTHRQSSGKVCRTPARKDCECAVAKSRVVVNCRKTVHRSAPLTVVKASSDCSDDLRLVRKGSALLHAAGGCHAHQNIQR